MSHSSTLVARLHALGLTENECKVYLAVVRSGECTASQVSRESHLQRTEIYPLMSGLVSKGLVEETIDRPKRYRPGNVKQAISQLAAKYADQFDRMAKASRQLAAKLKDVAASDTQAAEEEVRIVYGPHAARAHLLESVKSVEDEFWGIAGRKRPPHISDRFLAQALRSLVRKGTKTRFILEIDRENLSRVKRMTAAAEIAHYQPIPAYMYGADDKSVAVSLADEPIGRPSQTAQLVTSYRPTVRVMQQFFNILWRESTPFALREAILLGHRSTGEASRVMRGREESYLQSETVMDHAKDRIWAYIPTRYGSVRFLMRFSETCLRAQKRGVKIRIICRMSNDNMRAVKTLAKFMEVRHTDTPIGFSMGMVDNMDAAIYNTDPDSPELESSGDYMIRIASKQGIEHLVTLFEALWQESIPIEELLQRDQKPAYESSKPPG